MGKRVPKETSAFNSYLVTTDNFLQALEEGSLTVHNWERLGIASATNDIWHKARQDWDPLYLKFQDDSKRTTVVVHSINTAKDEFTAFAVRPLDQIASSDNATEEDAAIFHVVLSGTQKGPTHPTVAITEQCFPTIVGLGGAVYKISFRTSTDTGRPSIIPEANGIEVAHFIGTVAPTSAEAIEKTEIETKATITIHLGTENIGKNLYFACRWINTKYPELAGPWSEVFMKLIS